MSSLRINFSKFETSTLIIKHNKMKKIIFSTIIMFALFSSCDILQNLTLDDVIQYTEGATTPSLTDSDIVNGLKEALKVGTKNAITNLSQTDGFLKDPILKIAFPPEVQYVEEKLRSLGLNKVCDDFIVQMNRGAENAVVKAKPIFVTAITSMSISDAKNILTGADNAATLYFKEKTTTSLFNSFKPEVQNTLDQMNVTKYWSDVTTAYNKIPLTKKVETDLAKYVTEKAMDGLFLKIAEEEKKIRENPAARVSEILKKVFGSLD